MNSTEKCYQAYLMRLWRDGPNSQWRASLQSTKADGVRLFADVQDLLAFLQAQTSEPSHDAKTSDEMATIEIGQAG